MNTEYEHRKKKLIYSPVKQKQKPQNYKNSTWRNIIKCL